MARVSPQIDMTRDIRHLEAERRHVSRKPNPACRSIGYLMVVIAWMAFGLYGYRLYRPGFVFSVIFGTTVRLVLFGVPCKRSSSGSR